MSSRPSGRASRSPGAPGPRASALWSRAALALLVLLPLAACGTTDLPGIRTDPEEHRGTELPPPPEGGYRLEKPYPLLPGDQISVTVREDPDLSVTLTIPSTGEIEIFKSEKEGGTRRTVLAKGKTVEEIQDEIAGIYAETRFPFRPYVQVELVRAVARSVRVQGAVVKPGEYPVPQGSRFTLWRVILAAGGATDEGDLTRVVISRRDPATGTEASLPAYDLRAMERMAAYDRDPPLEPNDIVTVPVFGKVFIFGHIANPGTYKAYPGMRLTNLIAEAGGTKPFAKLGDVRVIRGGEGSRLQENYSVDVWAIINGKSLDPVILPGDRIWLDEDWK